ncbi:MAG TPA: hypothetical protein PLH22_02235 [Candidatus Colwellbacteria bacterium]|nr:hypothetical protein [Candidatus Colwellbacteria bacterium]
MKARKRRGRTVVVILLVIALIGMFVAFAMQTASLPPPVAEIPTEPDPVQPNEPTKPTEPDTPTVPTESKLKLMSFSQSGTVQSDVDANPDDENGVGALILCKMPPGTEIVLDLEGDLMEGEVSLVGKPQREYGLYVKTGIYGIIFHGVVPTDELVKQLGYTHAGSSKESVRVTTGTILGKVGFPLKNDWELEGCNLIIGIVEVNPDYIDLFEPSVASIIEAITR